VRIHVVGGRPHVAHPAAPVGDDTRNVRAAVAEGTGQGDIVARQAHPRRVLVGVVKREAAPAHQDFIRHRRAEDADDAAADGAADVGAEVRRGEGYFRRTPPDPARALDRFLLTGDADVGLRVVADVVVDARLEIDAVGRLQLAQHVVELVVRRRVVRLRVQVREHPADRRDVRGQVRPRRGRPGARIALRNQDRADRLAQVLAVRSQELAEVALALPRGGDDAEAGARVHHLSLDFEAGEEECLVAALVEAGPGNEDRPAHVATEVVELALRLVDARDAVRPVVGRELGVAVVHVERAVERRPAGLRDRADVHAAGAVLGREVRALDLDLLHHVVVQRHDDAAVRPDVDEGRAIQADRVAGGADAVDRVALRVVRAAAEADALERAAVRGDDAGQDAEELQRAAADDREVLDLVRLQHAFPSAGLRLHDLDGRRDRDELGQRPDLELDVQPAGVVGAERDALALVSLESFQLDLDVVSAGKEGRERIAAALVGNRRAQGLRSGIRDRDGRPGQHAARCVGHGAAHGCRSLRFGRLRRTEHHDRHQGRQRRREKRLPHLLAFVHGLPPTVMWFNQLVRAVGVSQTH
jgi:hypothetical protein